MGKLLAGGLILAATAPEIQFKGLQVLLELLAALAGIGTLIGAGVLIFKARSERDLNSTQAMALLFEKQRETNLDLLADRDRDIERLNLKLTQHTGESRGLREQLASCQRERVLLEHQVRGLEATIAELHIRLGDHYPRH